MSIYLLPELSEKSYDSLVFPLLADKGDPYLSFHGSSYPKFINISGTAKPFFSGGIVTDAEIELIGKGISQAIYDRHQGKSILIVTILEGARPFAFLVERHLRAMVRHGNGRVDFSQIKVRSYTQGSTASQHEVVTPLAAESGATVIALPEDLSSYDTVILLDDLIDTGATLSWLSTTYFPAFGARALESYCMLEKRLQVPDNKHDQERILIPVIGKIVPDEWLVGFGLDLALPIPGSDKEGLHLFREALPGGIYAFNELIEKELLQYCLKNLRGLEEQLRVYLSAR